MAEPDVLLLGEDLKKRFGEFGELKKLIETIEGEVKAINELNLRVGGNDEIGKQYHDQVDQATKDLSELVAKVREVVDKAGENGINLVKEFDYAKDTAAEIAASL
ncbi:hypothetical protein AB0K43_24115 [Kitasatospora sp. NPDC049258]|uniref:hypothetical protein n=1 Tax=Kitasatospora sp. NPDC049258 TaxID=3155394 RepID=UPI003442B3DC